MKKILMVLSTLILLTIVYNLSIHRAYAQTVNKIGSESIHNLTELQTQLEKVRAEMAANKEKITKVNMDIKKTTTEVSQLENEIKSLEEKSAKREAELKDRVRSLHQSGGNNSYLDVLIDSSSFSDFVDRLSAVATIVEADQELLKQQENEKKEIEKKKQFLSDNLKKMSDLKNELTITQAKLDAQQKTFELTKSQLSKKKQENSAAAKFKEIPVHKVVTTPQKNYINTVITVGTKYIGHSVYKYGGGRTASDISKGRFDCSGFVHWAFLQAGIEIGSSTNAISHAGKRVTVSEMRPGDIVFFDTYKKNGHVGIYLGNGKFIGSQSSTGVAIADMTTGYWKQKFKGHVRRI